MKTRENGEKQTQAICTTGDEILKIFHALFLVALSFIAAYLRLQSETQVNREALPLPPCPYWLCFSGQKILYAVVLLIKITKKQSIKLSPAIKSNH